MTNLTGKKPGYNKIPIYNLPGQKVHLIYLRGPKQGYVCIIKGLSQFVINRA